MKFFQWLRNLRRRPVAARSDSMRCTCCRQNIHKGERFIIEAARHRDCSDPKQTGQGRLFEPVPHMINGEQVNIAPMASMGTELLAGLPTDFPKSPATVIYEEGMRRHEEEYQNRPQPIAAPGGDYLP